MYFADKNKKFGHNMHESAINVLCKRHQDFFLTLFVDYNTALPIDCTEFR